MISLILEQISWINDLEAVVDENLALCQCPPLTYFEGIISIIRCEFVFIRSEYGG